MSSAAGTGCRSSFSSKASAGGQLEQPSDVNSSTSTGVRADSAQEFAETAAAHSSASRNTLPFTTVYPAAATPYSTSLHDGRAADVRVQMVDGLRLVGDDRPHQVADRDHP